MTWLANTIHPVFLWRGIDATLDLGMLELSRRNRIHMSTSWQLIRSLFSGHPGRTRRELPDATQQSGKRWPPAARVAIVALVAAEEQRKELTSLGNDENWEIQFAESLHEAFEAAGRLTAPVILCDRDGLDPQWRAAVQYLASLPHRPCVILTSRVSDDYLWEELIRQGGYELLAKPLRAPEAARVIRLAIIYWKNMAGAAVKESKTLHSSRS